MMPHSPLNPIRIEDKKYLTFVMDSMIINILILLTDVS